MAQDRTAQVRMAQDRTAQDRTDTPGTRNPLLMRCQYLTQLSIVHHSSSNKLICLLSPADCIVMLCARHPSQTT
jgi:hypothetical protein